MENNIYTKNYIYTKYNSLQKFTKLNEYLESKDILTSAIFDIFNVINDYISENEEFIKFCSENKKYHDRYYKLCDLLYKDFGLNFLNEARGGLNYGVFFHLELVKNDYTIQTVPVKISFSKKAFKDKFFLDYDIDRKHKKRCYADFTEKLYKEYIDIYLVRNTKTTFGSEAQQPHKNGEFKEFLNDIQIIYGNENNTKNND